MIHANIVTQIVYKVLTTSQHLTRLWISTDDSNALSYPLIDGNFIMNRTIGQWNWAVSIFEASARQRTKRLHLPLIEFTMIIRDSFDYRNVLFIENQFLYRRTMFVSFSSLIDHSLFHSHSTFLIEFVRWRALFSHLFHDFVPAPSDARDLSISGMIIIFRFINLFIAAGAKTNQFRCSQVAQNSQRNK